MVFYLCTFSSLARVISQANNRGTRTNPADSRARNPEDVPQPATLAASTPVCPSVKAKPAVSEFGKTTARQFWTAEFLG